MSESGVTQPMSVEPAKPEVGVTQRMSANPTKAEAGVTQQMSANPPRAEVGVTQRMSANTPETTSRVARPAVIKAARSTNSDIPRRLAQMGLVFAFGLVGLVAILLFVFAGYQLLYRDRIHRGVQVRNLDLSGLSRAEAQSLLETSYVDFDQVPWRLRDGEQEWTVTPAELGIQFDAAATAEAAHAVGRSRSPAWNLGEQVRSAWRGVQIAPVILYDEATARSYLEGLFEDVHRPVQNAALVIHGAEIFETRPQVGRELNIEPTLATLRQAAGHLTRSEISLVVDETLPRVIDASIAHEQARAIISAPLTLYVESEPYTGTDAEPPPPWQLSSEDLASMLVIEELAVGDEGSTRLNATLDQNALGARLTAIGQEISRTATNARYIFNDDTRQLEAIAPSVDGLALDVGASLTRISESADGPNREIALSLTVIPAEFNESVTAEQLGITELVASSTSYFAGSSQGRRNNVQIAASKFHGVVIKPGETFSFNEWLGEVTEEEGYDESLIIFGNETIPDVGGGICQVSTTAYRAAFWAGFPITERWAHAYRVGYYEQGGQPVGLDATIYSPHVDLKFANESPYHLLIETYVNQDKSTLTFKFYSTGNGRIVELEGPVVTDVIEHGEPVYREDAKLEPGEIKQIEWATDGLTSEITRVIRDATTREIIERKEFNSKFRPWDAVYLVGPGTEVPGQDVIRLDEQDDSGSQTTAP
jgi:vancomycin resistance protein YoaR